MIKVRMTLNIILFLSMVLIVYGRVQHTDINEIFVPNVFKRYDSTNKIQYHSIFLAKQSGLLFFKVGENTLQILEEVNLNLLLEYKSKVVMDDNFVVTSDGRYIVVILENNLTILEFDRSQLLINQIFEDKNIQKISFLKINELQTRIYVIRDQIQISIITFSTLKIQKGLLERQANVNNILISQDETWFFLTQIELGILVFKVIQISESEIATKVVTENPDINFSGGKIIKNEEFLVGQDYWQGLNIIDIRELKIAIQNGETNIKLEPILSNWWITNGKYPYSNALETYLNGNQILVGSRSEGIYVLDIEDVSKPEVFQLISVKEDIFSIIISQNNPYLYLFTKKNILIFKRDQANLQMNYPNLYNKHASILSPITITPYSWRSKMLSDNQHLIVTCSDSGILIAKLNEEDENLEIVSRIKYEFLSYTDNLMLFGNETFLLFPVQDPDGYILDIYDISNKSNPIRVERISHMLTPYIYSMAKNEEETLFAYQELSYIVFQEISIVNIPSPKISFKLLSNFDIPYTISSQQSNSIVILSSYSFLILLFRDHSIVSLNISNLKDILVTDDILSFGAEDIVQGKYLKQYCFISDGLEGVSILDLNSLPKLNIISNVKVIGYTNFITLINEDRLIITNQLTGGQLGLINLSNINEPQVISYLQFKQEFSAAGSVSWDSRYTFSLNAGGIRTIPIKQNIYIHYDFSERVKYTSGITESVRIESINATLKVGQIIEILLNPIYPIPGSDIMNAYYVENERLKLIPSWMSFDQFEKKLIINVIKDSLVVLSNTEQEDPLDIQNKITKHTVVFETKLVINPDSFVFVDKVTNDEIINLDASKKIHQSYKEKGILNHLNQISSQFAESEDFSVTSVDGVILSDLAIIKIKRVLQKSLNYSPIELQLQQSLFIDLQSTDKNYIKSFSKSAVLQLKIDSKNGKFVNKLYSGVVTSTSDKQDQIKLEGDLVNLNEILSSKIELYLFDQNNSQQVSITIQINDGINNEFSKKFLFINIANIIILKQKIAIQSYNKLQEQVNRSFSNSVIDINSSVNIEFSFDTYQNTQFSNIVIQSYFKDDNENEEEEVNNQNPQIQFSPQQFKFIVKTEFSDFNKQFCFRVNSTDTYSWLDDSFCVVASGISFAVFFNVFIQVIGPLLFFLGLFKYWNKLFNLTYYKRNICCEKQIFNNQQFVQKFIVINDSYKIGAKLFQAFLKELKIEKKSQRTSFNEFKTQKSMNKSTLSMFTYNKNDINPDLNLDFQGFDLNQDQNKNIKYLISKTITLLTSNKSNQKLQMPNKYELNKYYNNGSLDSKQFINDLRSSGILKKNLIKHSTILELNNELEDSGGILFNCLKGLLIKKLLSQNQNKLSHIVYHYIREHCKITLSHINKNLWTSIVAEVVHSLGDNQNNHESIIPYVKIKKNVIQNILYPIFQNMMSPEQKDIPYQKDSNSNILENLQAKLGLDLTLIYLAIKEDAIGIINPTNSSLFPNSGVSIHLQEHDIKKIQAYVKNSKKQAGLFSRCFTMEYVPLFSRKNQKLPSWLNIKIEKQLITLYGKPPHEQSNTSIKISIYNNNECIIREMIVQICQCFEKGQFNTIDQFADTENLTSPQIPQFNNPSKKLSFFKNFQTQEVVSFADQQTSEQLQTDLEIKQVNRYRKHVRKDSEKSEDCIKDSNIFQLNRKISRFQNSLLTSPSYESSPLTKKAQF